MEYVRSKLQINRHKNDTPHILFRKIAQEIAYETQIKLNISVDYELTLWLIRLLSLKPKYSNGSSRLFERAAVDALIKDYLQIVSDPDNIFVAIVKMQIYYIDHHIDKHRIIAHHQTNLDKEMQPLFRTIIDTNLKSTKECDEYVKMLAVDIIAHYALGNPNNPQVVQETINALRSMMSTNDVIAFSTLCEKDKIESLSGIREIVCGMRAFNRDAGHCGEGLLDMEQTVRNGYKTTKLQLTASLNEITSRIKVLIEPFSAWPSHGILPESIKYNNMIKLITLNRQCEHFLYDLSNTLSDLQIYIDRCLKNFRCQLNKIHEIVKFRTAIPITSIFPKFIELAKLWEQLQHQTYILSEINMVNGQLMLHAQHPLFDGIVKDVTMSVAVHSPNYGVNDGVNRDTTMYSITQKVIEPKIINTSKNEQIKIVSYDANTKVKFEAFCAYTISIANGLLLSSDLSIGLVQYKNQNYAFSSVAAANLFIQNPDTCLRRITEVICQNPEFALFFDIYDLMQPHGFKSKHMTVDGNQDTAASIEQCTIGIQTELHPIPYAKDKNHIWNAWDLRRMAIQLANLDKCQTKSTQTKTQSTFGTQTNL